MTTTVLTAAKTLAANLREKHAALEKNIAAQSRKAEQAKHAAPAETSESDPR